MRSLIEAATSIPAIDVYKLGFGYYVLDGHHRVAVALTQGQVEIDANVIEYVAVADAQAPERFAARRAFERATGLTEVGAARPETYGILLDAIEHYKQEQGLDEMERAARRWFAEVFRPLWQTIRAREIIAAFPGYRSADLIARLAIWRQAEAPDLDWSAALDRFVDCYETVNLPFLEFLLRSRAMNLKAQCEIVVDGDYELMSPSEVAPRSASSTVY